MHVCADSWMTPPLAHQRCPPMRLLGGITVRVSERQLGGGVLRRRLGHCRPQLGPRVALGRVAQPRSRSARTMWPRGLAAASQRCQERAGLPGSSPMGRRLGGGGRRWDGGRRGAEAQAGRLDAAPRLRRLGALRSRLREEGGGGRAGRSPVRRPPRWSSGVGRPEWGDGILEPLLRPPRQQDSVGDDGALARARARAGRRGPCRPPSLGVGGSCFHAPYQGQVLRIRKCRCLSLCYGMSALNLGSRRCHEHRSAHCNQGQTIGLPRTTMGSRGSLSLAWGRQSCPVLL